MNVEFTQAQKECYVKMDTMRKKLQQISDPALARSETIASLFCQVTFLQIALFRMLSAIKNLPLPSDLKKLEEFDPSDPTEPTDSIGE